MATIRRYEMTDEQWLVIEPLLPAQAVNSRGRPRKDDRLMLNGILWVARSGATWRDVPERYGPWESVYSRFRKWLEMGVFQDIFAALALEAELSELMIDATVVSAHQHSAGAKKGANLLK